MPARIIGGPSEADLGSAVSDESLESPTFDQVEAGAARVRRGQQGESVAELQRLLNQAGAEPPLDEDGVFGGRTEGALQRFQEQSGLDPDGVLGPLTLSALRRPSPSPAGGNDDVAAVLVDRFESARGAGRKAMLGSEGGVALFGPKGLEAPTVKAGLLQSTGGAAASAPSSRPRHDASADAAAAYKAMKGGVFGLGTDEAALLEALGGKSAAQVDALRAAYADHYGRSLDVDVRDELSGQELEQANALLAGNRARADAALLHGVGLGVDQARGIRALEGKSPAELDAIRKEYRARYGQELDGQLLAEYGGAQRSQVEALLRGDGAMADAAALEKALSGWRADGAAVLGAIVGKSPGELKRIGDAYERRTGHQLRDDLWAAKQLRAFHLVDGEIAKAEAVRIKDGLGVLWNDDKAIYKALEGKGTAEREAIAREYQALYGQDLSKALTQQMGSRKAEKAGKLLQRGALSDVDKLQFELNAFRPDAGAIRGVLSSKSAAQVDALRADWKAKQGTSLDDVVAERLDGRDLFDVRLDLRGKPETPDEALWRLEATREFERGGWENAVGRKVLDAVTDKGERLDSGVERAKRFQAEAAADGKLEDAERARLMELMGYAAQDVDSYRAAKDTAADAVANGASIAAATGVTVLTAGVTTPVVAALAAAGVGASAQTSAKFAMKGSAVGVNEYARDIVAGALGGVGVGVGEVAGQMVAKLGLRKAAEASARAAMEQAAGREGTRVALVAAGEEGRKRVFEATVAEAVERSGGLRVATAAAEGAGSGATAGAVQGAGAAALDGEIWEDGVASGLRSVGARAVAGATAGAALGGALGAVKSIIPGRAAETIVRKEEVAVANPPYDTKLYGDFANQTLSNRILEAVPKTVSVPGGAGLAAEVQVFGAVSERELSQVRRGLERLAQLGGSLNLPREVHIRALVGTKAAGLAWAGETGSVILRRDQLLFGRSGQGLLFHEAAHDLDHKMGLDVGNRLKWGNESPFGRGKTVTRYAKTNANEDFAETFQHMIENWDRIAADPERYLSNGDIGAKLTWIADHTPFDPRKVAP